MGNNPQALAAVRMVLTCAACWRDGKTCISWYYYCQNAWIVNEPSSTCFHHYGQLGSPFRRCQHDSRWNDDISVFRAMGGQAKLTRTGDVTDNLDLPIWRSLTPSKNPRVKSHRVAICQATLILFSQYMIPLISLSLSCMFANKKSWNWKPTNYTSSSLILALYPEIVVFALH